MKWLRLWVCGILSVAAAVLLNSPAMAGGFKGEVAGKENPISISRQVKEKEAVLIPDRKSVV